MLVAAILTRANMDKLLSKHRSLYGRQYIKRIV